MKRFLLIPGKVMAFILLFALSVILLSEFSPIYDFENPKPFCGPDVFNPYCGLDSLSGWKRANFHTHTRVDNILNECPGYPDEVFDNYMKLGYDILTFSNHNLLTEHPYDTTLQVNVYEHGINLFKFHKLVFNPSRMILHDPLVPFLGSQRQWELDYLGRNADFTVLNHPDRTLFTTPAIMRRITSYRLIEADSGVSTELRLWDEALSAGHYSFCLCSDDNHNSSDHRKTAIRCSWLNSPSASYEDLRHTLLSGRFYSMRIPDFGNGDWAVKYEKNGNLPFICDIGSEGDSLFISLSKPAEWIKVTGQDHRTLDSLAFSSTMSYVMSADDSYARFTACFDDGVYIYTNPFARYDKGNARTPYRETGHEVNILLTILYNLVLLLLVGGCVRLNISLFSDKKHKS